MGFVHLHCHSAFSLLEGTATPPNLIGSAKKLHMPALSLTDRNNLYGAVSFYIHAQKAGIKPIIGMSVDLDDGSSVVLLARNMDGYRNLCHLSTVLRLNSDPEAFTPAGFDDDDEDTEYGGEIPAWEPGVWGVPVLGFTPRPGKPPPQSTQLAHRPLKAVRLPREMILSGRHVRGLIALSGGRRGLVNSLVMQGKSQRAAKVAGMFLSAFGEGNFFIELTALGRDDTAAIPALIALANNLSIPVVATNDVLYLAREDANTALALASARIGARGRASLDAPDIFETAHGQYQEGNSLTDEVGTERYFKSAEEMVELFSAYPQGAQAIANTQFIADQCNLELPLHKPLFPSVDLQGSETPFSRLWKLCFAGATRRYRPLTQDVIARLKYELEVIESLGFSPYFLVVYDIVHFAHSRDIPIMARGSAADSLVAYVLGITQIDPLQHDLLFERFLSRERAEFELPDIDLDLCWRRRDEVLHYVYERYGRDHAAIVGTHITFRLRSAWREMAKAMGVTPGRISYIANRLSHISQQERDEEAEAETGLESMDGIDGIDEPGTEAADTYSEEASAPRLSGEHEQRAFELARAIQGLPRHAGMHCAGVVITPSHIPLADLVPLQRAARDPSMSITQYEKDAIEALGLVKMDLLGSRALTTLVDALRASGLAKGSDSVGQALEAIPFDDERTYRMIANGDTLGCFQLESPGMRGLVKWLRPHSLGELAMAVSLFRPGPLEGGFLETFMRRHLGQAPVTYPHPSMEPLLKETNGVILYQEQFLKLVHQLAGLGLGEAEQLRKALGKAGSAEERARLGSRFVAGAIERGIDQLRAEKVWEIVSGYSGFGFCAAHAHTYALTAYRSAYVKAHYPAEYIAAMLNNQGGYYGPSVYVEDARRLRVRLLLPHINESGAWCEVPPATRSIRFGLQFVKGVSEKTISALLTERRSGGHFRSVLDLMSRVQMSPTEITALVKVGACDDLGSSVPFPLPSIPSISSVASIAPLPGEMGEPIGAVYSPHSLSSMNRRQMMALLPQLLFARKPARQANRNSLTHLSVATGSEGAVGLGMQGVMGDILQRQDSASPRILGDDTLRIEMPHVEEYTAIEKLRLEQEVVGFSLTCNEMELIEVPEAVPSKELHRYAEREVKVAGIAAAGHRHTCKDGSVMLFLTLQDRYGLIETVLFPDAYKAHIEVLAKGGNGPYLVSGRAQITGKGRAIGVQPPSDLQLADAVALKMHPVVVVEKIRLLNSEG